MPAPAVRLHQRSRLGIDVARERVGEDLLGDGLRLGDVPLGGFFCNGEIGPVHGTTFLHGYTSAFGLFRPRH